MYTVVLYLRHVVMWHRRWYHMLPLNGQHRESISVILAASSLQKLAVIQIRRDRPQQRTIIVGHLRVGSVSSLHYTSNHADTKN